MTRFTEVLKEIDATNQLDPREESMNGRMVPKEYAYSVRMTEMLEAYDPAAGELLRIAARGQHIRRWAVPRGEYPMDRGGYLKWRTVLKLMHADLLEEIMRRHGYATEEISTTRDLVMKKKLRTDAEAQKLEDVVCLVFLKYYFEDFAQQHAEEKVVDILRKTWSKMTDKGHRMALELQLTDHCQRLVKAALDG